MRAPSEAKRTAAARPMPPAPPVMTTTLSVNRRSMSGAHLALGSDSTQAWGAMTEAEALRALLGPDEGASARAATAQWEMWHRSGDREVDTLLREGVAVMARRDLAGAEAIFARVIERAPEFAEVFFFKQKTAY